MKHYDLTAWTDFARGLLSAENATHMSEHLLHCTLCSHVASLLRRATDAGLADRTFEPSAELVASAEQIFSGTVFAANLNILAKFRRLAGVIRWDSPQNPLPAGIRSMRTDSRHLACQAGGYSVDLWFDAEPVGDRFTLTGQIANAAEPEIRMGDLTAVLLSGEHPVASATTTEFGEFSLRYQPVKNLRLILPLVHSGEYVDIPLNLPDINKIGGAKL